MRKIILFIATSLDGYIARENGDIDWLFTDGDYGYKKFYDSIEITLTGNATYKQTLTFGEFPFPGKTNYIFTRHIPKKKNPSVTFISGDIAAFGRKLKQQSGSSMKDIWLVGGGEINEIFRKAGLIDDLILSIHPIILGKGIPLFKDQAGRSELKIISSNTYPSGLVQVHYTFM
ncbi:MAG TPA: dihydrofolate reductase family protein [Candidatus Kapabacteria bacterium]|nr:dihydrofolate reductase family protein [Candidatus Kapabacteria bacterium]